MSVAQTTRADIAYALSTVEGVTGYEVQPNTPTTGDAWPVWAQTEFVSMVAFTMTWDVYVVLPAADLATTTAEADPWAESIAWALSKIGVVNWVQPSRVMTDPVSNAAPALTFNISTT